MSDYKLFRTEVVEHYSKKCDDPKHNEKRWDDYHGDWKIGYCRTCRNMGFLGYTTSKQVELQDDGTYRVLSEQETCSNT